MGKQLAKCITEVTVLRHPWLRDYARVCINQWPMSLLCLPIGQLAKK